MKMHEIRSRMVLLDNLKELGIKSIRVEYSGSGDSGQIDDVSVDHDDPKILEKHKMTMMRTKERWTSDGWKTEEVEEDSTLYIAVENFCYDALEKKEGGWENNDGADGIFEIDVESGKIEWVHNTHIMSVETTTREI